MARAAVLGFLCCLVAPSVGSPLHPDKYERAFAKYMKEYNRSYATSLEKLARFNIFRTRLQLIDEVNAEDVGFHLAPNKLTDRFPEEQRQDRRDRLFVQGPDAGRAESVSRLESPALGGARLTPAPAPAPASEAVRRMQPPGRIALNTRSLEIDPSDALQEPLEAAEPEAEAERAEADADAEAVNLSEDARRVLLRALQNAARDEDSD